MDVRGVGRPNRRSSVRAVRLAGAAVVGVLAIAQAAQAFYLDEDRNLSVRLRTYAQVAIATQNSYTETDPPKSFGQVMQNRYFANPEFDAKWAPYLPQGYVDELTTRLALWGFYDGLYDYGPAQYADRLSQQRFHYEDGNTANPFPHGAFITDGYSPQQALEGRGSRIDIRDEYARRWRVNEAYVSVAKGPIFLRIGRQAISWGESDTIGLLDANNPFDVTIVPGVFADLDEQRIPLWTARMTAELFNTVGPFSSGFLDSYIVPGMIDTTISPFPIGSASPYSPPPAAGPAPPIPGSFAQGQEQFLQLPSYKFGNSRWGVRFQTVIARNFTTSLWFYKTFNQAPTPVLLGISQVGHGIVAQLNERLENVAGIATTFYSDWINSIIRAEIEVFNNEPAFRYATNFAPFINSITKPTPTGGHFDKVNIIRGELGVDRNFFITALNPSTSFTNVNAFVFTALPDETKFKDYRAGGLLKPSALRRQAAGGAQAGAIAFTCDGQNPGPGQPRGCDFVNESPFSAFVQSHVETAYMHGKLAPAVTVIMNTYGALAFLNDLSYRWTDSFITSARYVNIHTFGNNVNDGFDTGLGLFRDRDQVWFRATYQIN
jgi:hypothetical protein